MSFFFDPPLLFILGSLLFLAGKRFELGRLAKITLGIMTVLSFILFSSLLYADVFKCAFPAICKCPDGSYMSGSAFMLHSAIWPYTGLHKADVPWVLVVAIFHLYPVVLYHGYALALMVSKGRRKALKETYSYEDVKSHERISDNPSFSVIRYPDMSNGIGVLTSEPFRMVVPASSPPVYPPW